MNMEEGYVFWVTGLSGAGKTTIGKKLYEYIREYQNKVIFLDGDILRSVLDNSDYSSEGRKKLGMQYARLCKMLCSQGVFVVICVVAMFDEVRDWNRNNIINYKEIFLNVPFDELEKRNQKKMYSRAKKGEISNVYGYDINAELPKYPDVIIDNYGDVTSDIAFQIICENCLDNIIKA